MKLVSELLASKLRPYNVIDPDASVIEALQLLSATNHSYLVVIEGDSFQGIFSERDYSRNVSLHGKHSSTCKVKEVMSVVLPFVSPDDTVEKCIHLILDHQTRYLPVLNEEVFEGVVTIHDILRLALVSKSEIFDEELTDSLLDAHEKIY